MHYYINYSEVINKGIKINGYSATSLHPKNDWNQTAIKKELSGISTISRAYGQ